ncbi:uncharacterized protein BDZ83DRAFT_601547 [Colletotrichum acutatum]|uniref:Uncharacterized protein n=1 Tax=Glomerella acutata TaxID=27357 RepID=A0AAD8XNI4_GLOAC|nr:uncharacterized protein BDZ83DRAFT_601547 [Colletotrichum acutatum]KAK1730557.1 hypothetical protein BDZ83DRAFT_601547 [Colletotrichum acutatum]
MSSIHHSPVCHYSLMSCARITPYTSIERASKKGASGQHMQHDTPSSFFTPPPSLPVTAASHAVPILLDNPTQYLILGLGWAGNTEDNHNYDGKGGGVRKWAFFSFFFFLSLRWGRQRASRETSYVPRTERQSGRRRDSEKKRCVPQKRPARSQGGRGPRRPWACSRPASLFLPSGADALPPLPEVWFLAKTFSGDTPFPFPFHSQ